MSQIKIEVGANHTMEVPKGMGDLVEKFLLGAGMTELSCFSFSLGQAVKGGAQLKGRVKVLRKTPASVILAAQPGDNSTRYEIHLQTEPERVKIISRQLRCFERELRQKSKKAENVGAEDKSKANSLILPEQTTIELAAMAIEEQAGSTLLPLEETIKKITEICNLFDDEIAKNVIDRLVEDDRIDPVYEKGELIGYRLKGFGQENEIKRNLARLTILADQYEAASQAVAPIDSEISKVSDECEKIVAEFKRRIEDLEAKKLPYLAVLNDSKIKGAAKKLAQIKKMLS